MPDQTTEPLLDQAAARRLTMGIQLRLDNIASNIEQVIPLIEQARTSNVHEVLGYKSWTSYVQDEFGGRLARLQRAERQPIVELLSATGMPTRAIGSVVGVSHETVAADLRVGADHRPQVSDCLTPAPVTIPGVPADEVPGILAMADATEARTEGDLSQVNVVTKMTERKVTGRDGKSYTVQPPAPPKQRRRPLPDAYRDAAHDLLKAAERLQRLHADDRFPANWRTVDAQSGPETDRAVEILLGLDVDISGRRCGRVPSQDGIR